MCFIRKLVCLLMMVACISTLAGCTAAEKEHAMPVSQIRTGLDPEDYTGNLNLQDVIDALADEGIELAEISGAGQTLRLNEVTPSVFAVNGTEEIMLVYVCPSIGVRTLIYPDYQTYGYQPSGWVDPDYLPSIKPCKNVLIIYEVSLARFLNNPRSFPGPYDQDRWRRVQEAVWKLNDAQETVLEGTSAHWEGKVIINSYNHWYRDINNNTQCEIYSKEDWKVKYLGQPGEVRQVVYSMHYPFGSSRGPADLDDEGYLRLSSHEGSHIFNENMIYNITLEWQGHKEKLTLKR